MIENPRSVSQLPVGKTRTVWNSFVIRSVDAMLFVLSIRDQTAIKFVFIFLRSQKFGESKTRYEIAFFF